MDIRRLGDKDAAIYWTLRLDALRSEPPAFGRDAQEYEVYGTEPRALRVGDRYVDEHQMILLPG